MQRFFRNRHATLATSMLLALLFAVACGGASTPTPVPTKAPPPAVAPPAAPAVPVAAATATPTATPKPTPAPLASAVHPGKVTWMTGDFGDQRFDRVYSIASGSREYAQLIHAYLLDSDVVAGGRKIVPGIVTHWSMSGDGLTWTVTVGKGARFHDGTEVTVEDVLWTLQHVIGPQAAKYALQAAAMSKIMVRIEQVGPDKVSLTSKSPIVEFPFEMSGATGNWIGAVLPKRATLDDVKEAAAYDRNPIGAGIMRLVKHVPSDSMLFERFADYYHQPKNGLATDKRVKFAAFDLRLVPEEATRAAALRAGEADIGPLSSATKNQVEAGGGRLIFGQEGVVFSGRQLGCWKPQFPCHDRRVRQALQYAIDKELIRDRLYGGTEVMQVKGWEIITPSTVGYSPELDPFPFDPAKARQLLAEAGYPGGKDFGTLVVNTNVSKSLPFLVESAQAAADMWRRELGLNVEVKVGDTTALKKASTLTENLHGQIWWRENEARLDGSKNLITGEFWGGNRGPDQAHNDSELILLAAKTSGVLDPVQREKALNAAYRRFRDEAYWISLGYINIPWGVGPRIRTWEPYPLAFYPSALHTITLK